MSFISKPMGWILAQLSELLGHNFAASVLLFTVLVNLLMLPLTLKSQKSTAKQAKIKHKLDALKKKYGDDRQKYSVAMQELYNKEGISMGGGCMPMIVRFIIMIGVYYAIAGPFTYVVNVNATAINQASKWASYVKVAESYSSDENWAKLGLDERMDDADIIAVAEKFNSTDYKYYAKLSIVSEVAKLKDVAKDSPEAAIRDKISDNRILREVEIASYLNGKSANNAIVADVFTANGGDIDKLDDINFDLFKIDLTETPDFSWNVAKGFELNWLIPISSFLAAVLTGVLSSIMQKKANPEAPNMMAMMLIMPLFSLYIAFSAPCAVGFYWACSSLISGGIQIIIQMFYGPNVVNAREQAKCIIERAKKENLKIASVNSTAEE